METIRVVVRARPMSPEEAEKSPWCISNNSIGLTNQCPFQFDRIFGGECKTKQVYDEITKNIVASALSGFNGTIFAYGQTNTGKTHTMRGSELEPGIILLAVKDLFDMIKKDENREFLVRMSYMEIYNEEIHDLLVPKNSKLKVYENAEGSTIVAGLKEEIVISTEQVLTLVDSGESHRHKGKTNMNLYSSRSHSIFRMIIESHEKVEEGDDHPVRFSILNLVDLAGSERVSKIGAKAVRMKEGSVINKSLLTLGIVIKKLSEGAKGQDHIPYRGSKLTRILQPALGGNANTVVICNITLAEIHRDETRKTLRFASRASRVKTCARVNEVMTDAFLLKRLRKEIEQLEDQIKLLQLVEPKGPTCHNLDDDVVEKYKEAIAELNNKLAQEENEKMAMVFEFERLKERQLDQDENEKKIKLLELENSSMQNKLDDVVEAHKEINLAMTELNKKLAQEQNEKKAMAFEIEKLKELICKLPQELDATKEMGGEQLTSQRAHLEEEEEEEEEGGKKQEIYTEKDFRLLGSCKVPWDISRKLVRDFGFHCHQCRRLTGSLFAQCCKIQNHRFCGHCLYRRYGENVEEVEKIVEWICPFCRGICNCGPCRVLKRWERLPNNISNKCALAGYKSVAHYLMHTRRGQSCTGISEQLFFLRVEIPRKRSLGRVAIPRKQSSLRRGAFGSAVVRMYQDNGGDLDLMAKDIESSTYLNFSRYGDTFFEVVITGGRTQPGTLKCGEDNRHPYAVLDAQPTREAMIPFVVFIQKTLCRRPFLIRNLENVTRRFFQSLELFEEHQRKNMAIFTALTFSQKLALTPETVFQPLFNDALVAKGLVLYFMTDFCNEYLRDNSLGDLISLLKRGKLEDSLVDNILSEVFSEDFNNFGCFDDKNMCELKLEELKSSLMSAISEEERDVDEVIEIVKQQVKEAKLSDIEAVHMVSDVLIDAVNQRKNAALRQVKTWAKLLSGLCTTSSANLELELIHKVQVECHDVNLFAKVIWSLYEQNVLSEDIILMWFKNWEDQEGRLMFVQTY